MKDKELHRIAGSFRDPSGGVFLDGQGRVYRTVNRCAKDVFDRVEASGLPAALEKEGLLLPAHREDAARFFPDTGTASGGKAEEEVACLLSHPRIPFISYPYEWGFAQLRRAALLHLEIHRRCLAAGFTLSDATAYNIQFQGSVPIFIDRLSIVPYAEGMYWAGQKQFVAQFLAPLLLWSHTGIPPHAWYRGNLHGIAAEHVRRILPFAGKLSLAYLSHVALPAFFERRQQGRPLTAGRQLAQQRLPKEGFLFMLRQLEKWLLGLRPPRGASFWQDYSAFRSYSKEEMRQRLDFVGAFVADRKPAMVWDIGCNNGEFLSQALNSGAAYGVGFDIDHGALAAAYEEAVRTRLPLLPLHMDLCNPSPGLGWEQGEREGFRERRNADMLLALAVLHHIVIGNNVPLARATAYFLDLAPAGIMEWVPKSDPMVENMLASREDIFSDYHIDHFRGLLQARVDIVQEKAVSASGRTLFAYAAKR